MKIKTKASKKLQSQRHDCTCQRSLPNFTKHMSPIIYKSLIRPERTWTLPGFEKQKGCQECAYKSDPTC